MTQERQKQKWQPIPQDINIEADNYCNEKHSDHSNSRWENAHDAFIAGAQLLLPELQQLREALLEFKKELDKRSDEAMEDALTIEQQKSQIDELKKEAEGLRIVIKGRTNIEATTAEIESLKRENEEYSRNLKNAADVGGKLVHEKILSQWGTDYWKQRCEAAEYLLSPDAHKLQPQFDKWKQLKQQKHG